MNSIGNQADERKFRQPTLRPGAWAGLIIHTNTPFPMKPTTGKKWTKFKDGLNWLIEEVLDGAKFVKTGTLRSLAGLGVHITEIYTHGRCFLKSFFNAVEAWRGDRDLDGWRLSSVMDLVSQLEVDE